MIKLSMEQAFNVQCQSLKREEAIELLTQLYRQIVIKETLYKEMLMNQLGVGLPRHE
jgi:Phycobilisome degradation protein nblA